MPESLTRKIAKKLLSVLECSDAELSILLTTDKEIQQLNAQYRGKDAPTDVLSFPQLEDEPPDGSALLGDIVISMETANRQADEHGVSFQEEILRLLIHGLLHLLGYDHENVTPAEAERMQSKEAELQCCILEGGYF